MESLKGQHILGLKGMPLEQMELILDTAQKMRGVLAREDKKFPVLRGKSVINLFFENSTRTRTSFELAGKYLGADVVNMSVSTSSVAKGESFRDTLLTISAMAADAIVIRHSAEGSSKYASETVKSSIINAGDGAHEHPTQGLLDILTIKQHKGNPKGMKVVLVGDISHSRVARSNIFGLQTLGADVHVMGPATLMPHYMSQLGVTVHNNIEEALEGADIVNVLRLQRERQQSGLLPSLREYARLFGVNAERLKLAKKDVLLMHPGPMNRGVEIASDVAYCEQSAINEQVTNGLAVRMALLSLVILGGVEIENAN